ncbi:hypothetical protein EMIHUDRAFT_230451 [Emiliania huxleyi CCMP1516]|uniref:Chromo domain-containing protein n=2 Tax=Emiliania huxleyi TaxID=2903 RepID=A0A0D3KA96_EMIH1|nr:hypothetical protein EMIHUDRAFT_230451 [Emiliania huxleyi CCMP1516]EOD32681.1 hypothetical protein EMIHUDRAFT_230451 [Emiliania huxleyi CCMP1516]|eukprot:XP_005785110.1 hypothetical protein EMIHUDRAFT_230451 [Emiliania huxleyi CCMP1516]
MAGRGALERVFVGLCRRTEGCCLPAGHRGACDLREVAEVDYEVECIREQKRRRGKLTYLVKWRGWPDEDNTWEAEDALEGCPDDHHLRSDLDEEASS